MKCIFCGGRIENCNVTFIYDQDPDRILYLAVPLDTYKTFFTLEFSQIVIQRFQIKLIVYDVEKEVIVKWQN